ncbi:MAG: RNA polymerase sigma factor [Deltaproteobacteria bacterium]|nr:RNA polymerase sigma factor [Deltaproteobacteria bacterium]
MDLLVARAQDGDRLAFEELYRCHVGRVYGLCLRLAQQREQAEELTQRVFVQAFEKIGTFRAESEFLSWLHRLTVNLVLTDMRTRRRREERVFPVADLEPLAGHCAAVPDAAASGVDLERALSVLPPQARAVFVLHDVEGYGHGEISQLTGLAIGTSKAHLHRARRRLRKELRK